MFTRKQLETVVDMLKQDMIKDEPIAVLISPQTVTKNIEKADNIYTVFGLKVYLSSALPKGTYYVGEESAIMKMAEELNKKYEVKLNEFKIFECDNNELNTGWKYDRTDKIF